MKEIQRCAIYIRVSTAEQAMNGKSLQAQRECLEKYAKEHNMSIVGVYADEGQTARKELKKRKAIHALLYDVKASKIDVILFWKMDRWFRSVSDFYKVQDVLDHYKVRWTAVAEPNMNMETRDGRLNLNIMLSIGQNEVDTTSERIKFTVNHMIDNGRLVWGDANMPFGYKASIINDEKKMIKDKKTSHMVEEFFHYFLTHQNKSATVKHMQNTFGIDFSYSMLRTMLSSEFYIGKYRKCENYCPAYLTPEQWQKIQEISDRNIKQARSGRIYLFSGLIRCPLCGQILVGTGCSPVINRKTGEKRTYCYYRCNRALIDKICTFRRRLSQIAVEEYLINVLETECKKYLTCTKHIQRMTVKKKVGRSKNVIKSEINRLNTLFQKGRIGFEYYDEEYKKLEEELESVPKTETNHPDQIILEKVIHMNLEEIYHTLSQAEKQVFWRNIISQIHIDDKHSITCIDFF